MNNSWITNYIKFSLTFITFVSTSLGLYYFFTVSETEKTLSYYENDKIRNICPQSSESSGYQLCFRRKISTIATESSPLDILKIGSTINKLRQRDLYQARTSTQKELFIVYYYTNWSIFIDYVSQYQIKRDHIDFFQIAILPIIRNLLQRQVDNVVAQYSEDIEEFPQIQKSEELKRAIKKLRRIQFNFFKQR